MNKKYRMRVVRGAFQNLKLLDEMGARTIEKINDDWVSIDEVIVDLDGVKKLQQEMTKHYHDPVPWYMDGRGIEDENEVVVAFGADDGEGGRIFKFKANDEKAIQATIKYGTSKGIPKEQLDFMDIKF